MTIKKKGFLIIIICIVIICVVLLPLLLTHKTSIPVYISLTSIYKNQNILYKTLKTLLQQSICVNQIYLYLSSDEFFLDTGFKAKKITDKNLSYLLKKNKFKITLKWVKNIGSYRKLVPLLKQKWKEDCIIITTDDDTAYNKDLVKNLLTDYTTHKCVISYRGFTPRMQTLYDFNYEKRRRHVDKHKYNFATGKGGILYKPQFFHKTPIILREDIFLKLCPHQDDVWFYLFTHGG